MTQKVWLDTDIGTDVDDAVALSLALSCPELELVGVSTVYGDVQLRARMVLKLLALAERDDVPVYAGASQPLMRTRDIYWAGWEGEGLLQAEDDWQLSPQPTHAAVALVEAVNAAPGEITLLTIGPMTNAALALSLDPDLPSKLRAFVLMGGAARTVDWGMSLPVAEHNLKCDPEAAAISFRAGGAMTMVGLDVTTRVWFHREGLGRLTASGRSLAAAVADQLGRYPTLQRQGRTMMHDPLTVAYLVRPELVTLAPAEVSVETANPETAGATWVRAAEGGRVQVARDVDAAAFEEFLLERLTTS